MIEFATTRRENSDVRHKPRDAKDAEHGPGHSTQVSGLRLYRKASCACGGGCPSCQAKPAGVSVSQPHDADEREADRMADKVMRKPAAQAQASSKPPASSPGHSSGNSLDAGTRGFMESRFGHDFSGVRVHHDHRAAESARSFDALAYTHGSDIVFGQGQYDPHSDRGRHLLAHELAHVVQHSAGGPKKISRAKTKVSGQTVNIDYGDVMKVTDTPADIKRRIEVFTGTPPAADVVKKIDALAYDQQRWLLFALDILMDNTTSAHGALDKNGAVGRLIDQAAISKSIPAANRDKFAEVEKFVKEVMLTSGWTAAVVAKGLVAPSSAQKADIQDLVNPRPGKGGKFDLTNFDKRMMDAFTTFLNVLDPAKRSIVKTQSMTDIQAVGDVILAEARAHFSPFSDAAPSSIFNMTSGWKASANISDTNTQALDTKKRMKYLTNRAQVLGRNDEVSAATPDTFIFSQVNFNPENDAAALEALLQKIEKDKTLQPLVDKQIQHTGFEEGVRTSTRMGVDPEYDEKVMTECEARWITIDTLCHEILHALVHPDFLAAAGKTTFSLVGREGFTEVLGNELFNDRIVEFSAASPKYRAQFEIGLKTPKCPIANAGKIDYGAAGKNAEAIRKKVGDENFRAAYFLGRHDLVGF
jgi:hypothetical protein